MVITAQGRGEKTPQLEGVKGLNSGAQDGEGAVRGVLL